MAKRRTRGTAEPTQSTPTTPTELPTPPEPGDSVDRTQQSAAPISEAMGSEPSEEDIRVRAYHRFLHRGGHHGGHVDDWMEAERELRRKKSEE